MIGTCNIGYCHSHVVLCNGGGYCKIAAVIKVNIKGWGEHGIEQDSPFSSMFSTAVICFDQRGRIKVNI